MTRAGLETPRLLIGVDRAQGRAPGGAWLPRAEPIAADRSDFRFQGCTDYCELENRPAHRKVLIRPEE